MVATTATQNLRYTTGGDIPKAAGEALKDLAERVDARIDGHDRDLATSSVPPMTVIERLTPARFELGFSDFISFDTVQVDTQSGADLALDSRLIKINRSGIWMFGGLVHCNSLINRVTTAAELYVEADGMSLDPYVSTSQYDVGTGLFMSCSTFGRASSTSEINVAMNISHNGTTTGTDNGVLVRFAQLWAYWLGDLP